MANTGTTDSNQFLSGAVFHSLSSSIYPSTSPEAPLEGIKFTWHWLLAPLACAFVIFVCFECLVIRRRCKRRRYKPALPLLPGTGGARTYERYGTSMDSDPLGGSSGLPSTASLIPSTGTREPLRVPCTVCGNSASGGSVRMGVSSYRENRPFRARNPRTYKNPLYWYRVPLRELGETDSRTIRTVSSCTSVMTETTSGGQSTDGDNPLSSRGTTPTISERVSSTSTEFRGNGYVIKMEAERDREIITPPVASKVRRTPPSYESYRRKVQKGQIQSSFGNGLEHTTSDNGTQCTVSSNDRGSYSKPLESDSLNGIDHPSSADKGIQCNGHVVQLEVEEQNWVLMTPSRRPNIHKNPPGYHNHRWEERRPSIDRRDSNEDINKEEVEQNGEPVTLSSRPNSNESPLGHQNHRREEHHPPTAYANHNNGDITREVVGRNENVMTSSLRPNIYKNPPGYRNHRQERQDSPTDTTPINNNNGHVVMNARGRKERLVMSSSKTDARRNPPGYRSNRREDYSSPLSSNYASEDERQTELTVENVADTVNQLNNANSGGYTNGPGISEETEREEGPMTSSFILNTNGHSWPPISKSEQRQRHGLSIGTSIDRDKEIELPANDESKKVHPQRESDIKKQRGPPPPYMPTKVPPIYGGSTLDNVSITSHGWV